MAEGAAAGRALSRVVRPECADDRRLAVLGVLRPAHRLWELGAGGLLALCAAAPARLPRAVAAAGSWLGLSAILASALVYDADTPFPATPPACPSSAPCW